MSNEAAWPEVELERRSRCPVCDRGSIYVVRLDRFMHEDGSDNQECWLACSRGLPSP